MAQTNNLTGAQKIIDDAAGKKSHLEKVFIKSVEKTHVTRTTDRRNKTNSK